jgi:hypothetical protein
VGRRIGLDVLETREMLLKSFFISPTDALYYIKIEIYIKIHIEIAPTCFGLTTILTEHVADLS